MTAGRITAGQETVRYNAMLSKVTTLVVTPHPVQALGRSVGRFSGHGMRWNTQHIVQLIAGTCNTTPAALTSLLHAGGTSVLAACRKTNAPATQAQVTAVIFAPLKTTLDAEVAAGTITQAQATQRAAKAQLAIGNAITRTLSARAPARA